MIDPQDFRYEVIVPTLMFLGPPYNSPAAVNLLLGTALVESRLTYLRQRGGGPALGVYQIEPRTLRDVYKNFLDNRPALAAQIKTRWGDGFEGGMTPGERIKGDLFYATVIARLIYYRAPGQLPPANDARRLAEYHKQWYNTPEGATKVEDSIKDFEYVISGMAR